MYPPACPSPGCRGAAKPWCCWSSLVWVPQGPQAAPHPRVAVPIAPSPPRTTSGSAQGGPLPMKARPRRLQQASQTPVAPAGGAAQGGARGHVCCWGGLAGHRGASAGVEFDQGSYFLTYLPLGRGPQHHLGSAWGGPGLVGVCPSPAQFPPSIPHAHWCWGPYEINSACRRGEGLDRPQLCPSAHALPQSLFSLHVCTFVRPDLPRMAHTAHDRAAPCCGPTRRRYGPRHLQKSAKRSATA